MLKTNGSDEIQSKKSEINLFVVKIYYWSIVTPTESYHNMLT